MPGFPYLRSTRFLAHFAAITLSADRRAQWLGFMMERDREGRLVEAASLTARGVVPAMSQAEIEQCGATLMASDLRSDTALAALRSAVRVPDSYQGWKRALGLYPMTRLASAWGYAGWQDDYLASFTNDFSPVERGFAIYATSLNGRLKRDEVASLLSDARQNPLAIPVVSGGALEALLATHAPVWMVGQASSSDQIGTPIWDSGRDEGVIVVDQAAPAVFGRLSFTWFDGEILPQLVYAVWFPERPKTGPFDLTGGSLDAVIWRVTLALDGRPLVYDSIHACGCYHVFFPVPPVRRVPIPEDRDLRESAFVPSAAPRLREAERLVIRLQAGTHYVSGLGTWGPADGALRGVVDAGLVIGTEVPDQALRMAPTSDGHRRSLFGENGIIRQSRRLERWTLWPMGIKSPGAMRQWGTHATAFVGKRHFDDPFLIDRAFER